MNKCELCGKEYKTYQALNSHLGWHRNSNRKNNFAEYNEKVKFKERIPFNQWKNPDYKISDITRKKLSNSSKGRKHSNEIKEKLSEIQSKLLEERGNSGFKHIKWYHISNILNEEFIVRGTWELTVAKYLNKKNIVWKRKIYIKYVDNNNVKRTYTPDFYLPEYDRYIEVKGYFSTLDKEKMKLVKEQNNIKLMFLFAKHIKKIQKRLYK